MAYLEHLKANWKVAFHSLNDFLEHFLHGLIPHIKWKHTQPDNVLNYDKVSSNSIEPVMIVYGREEFIINSIFRTDIGININCISNKEV